MPDFNPLRKFDSRFAFSPHKESAYGTALIDAKFTRSTTPQGFETAKIAKQFIDNADMAWKATEFPTERDQVRQSISYPLNFNASALVAGMMAAYGMGSVVTTPAGVGPPAAYSHVFTFQDPVTDGHQLPSTGHWFKPGEDLAVKTKGAVCEKFSLSYQRNQPIIQLASNWTGNGDYVSAELTSVPTLATKAELGYLREKDLDILIGTPGAEVSIAPRVAACSVEISNGVKVDWGYYAGTGLYMGRAWIGKRTVTIRLTMLATDPDDVKTIFDSDTLQGFRLTLIGDVITGTDHHKLDIYVPNYRIGSEPAVNDQDGYTAWDLSLDVYQPTSPTEVCTVTIVNTEAAYLTA